MTTDSNEIFTKASSQQKRGLFELISERHIEVFCKATADVLFKLRPMKWEKERYLLCEKIADFKKPGANENITFSFTVDTEKYFFRSLLAPSDDGKWWRIDGASDLFKLQRRQAYRIRIPASYRSKAIMKDESGKILGDGSINDISSGGCKIQLPGSSGFKNGQVLTFELGIGRREILVVTGEIRHVHRPPGPDPKETLGVMFKSMNSILESKLFAITLELHRELAGKVSTG